MNNIIATQLLSAVKAAACSNDDGAQCSDHQVDVAGSAAFNSSDGPRKFAEYTLLVLLINVLGTLLFTPFLPRQKDQCVEWRRRGEEAGDSARVGCASITIATVIIGYITPPPPSCHHHLFETRCYVALFYAHNILYFSSRSDTSSMFVRRYGIVATVALLLPPTACMPVFGGTGCSS